MSEQPESFWEPATGDSLRQGDRIPGCLVPITANPDAVSEQVECQEFDLVVLTQSCDLAQGKAALVACCPIFAISEYERVNPDLAKEGMWERVRKGQIEGLHLLSSFNNPADNRDAHVVDFRQIYSLPVSYLAKKAATTQSRRRLTPDGEDQIVMLADGDLRDGAAGGGGLPLLLAAHPGGHLSADRVVWQSASKTRPDRRAIQGHP